MDSYRELRGSGGVVEAELGHDCMGVFFVGICLLQYRRGAGPIWAPKLPQGYQITLIVVVHGHMYAARGRTEGVTCSTAPLIMSIAMALTVIPSTLTLYVAEIGARFP